MEDGLWYYNFLNTSQFLKERMIKDGLPIGGFRYIKDIIDMRVGMFSYDNLPEGLTSEILETALMFCNKLCFYYSEGLGKWVLARFLPHGDYNEYMKPKFVSVMSLSGSYTFDDIVPYEDIILVKDNRMDIIPFLYINEYIQKISEIENTMSKVMKICSLPLAIVGNKKQATALKLTAKKMGNDDPFIVGDNEITDEVKSFNIEVPVAPLEFYTLRHKYINEARASLGIYSVDEKRERIVTQELLNLNDYSDTVYQESVNERKEWIKKLNEKGLNVVFKETYNQVFKQSVIEAKELAIANAAPEKDKKEDTKDEQSNG